MTFKGRPRGWRMLNPWAWRRAQAAARVMTWVWDHPSPAYFKHDGSVGSVASFKNEHLSDALRYGAMQQNEALAALFPPGPPPTTWQRWRYRITSFVDRWLPRVHLGPCPEGEDC